MKIYGLSLAQVQQAAQVAGVALYETSEKGSKKPYINTMIRPVSKDALYRKVAYNFQGKSRKVFAVDFLGHAAFFVACFAINPEAIIQSGLAKFEGVRDFKAQVYDLMDTNVCCQANPVSAYEACEASSVDSWENTVEPQLLQLAA